MEIILAESAGYCFGVRRALEKVYEQIEKKEDRRIYTYGPIIHNKEVVRELEEKDVFSINTPEEIPGIAGQIMIIRSHGVGRNIYELAQSCGIEIVDATCPYVKKIHGIVQKAGEEGRHVVIVGDENHPEVQGISGWACGSVSVIDDADNLDFLSEYHDRPVTVVSQTTFNASKFEYIVEKIKEKGYDVNIVDTICSATALRQKEAAQIAQKADLMIVVGDKHSSNTQKLFEICSSYCEDTYHIQTVGELQVPNLQSLTCVGITAGASTPDHIIQEVLMYARG